jgi:hypothetical protein
MCFVSAIKKSLLKKHKYFFSDLYSARLYTTKDKKVVIFCMCLNQPHYMKVSIVIPIINAHLELFCCDV